MLLFSGKESTNESIGGDKRKLIEQESIFSNNNLKKTKDEQQESKLTSLRDKLTKSIQKKKIEELCIDKSLLFDVKPQENQSTQRDKSSLVTNNKDVKNLSLVSNDYEDEQSD
jgi:hypothetical protein